MGSERNLKLCISNETQTSDVLGKYTFNMMIRAMFGIVVYKTIFSEALLEKEQSNFLLIQKYLSLENIIFMEPAMKHQRRLKWQTITRGLLFSEKKILRKWKKIPKPDCFSQVIKELLIIIKQFC